MKKVFTLALFVMLLLAFSLAANGDTSSTEVQFEISDSYILNIPAVASISSTGVGSMNISFTECHVDGVTITVDSNSYNAPYWYLTGTRTGNKLPYSIISGNSKVFAEGELYVSREGGCPLTLAVEELSLKNAYADSYRDTLVFTFR
jgi:hypothetical protein